MTQFLIRAEFHCHTVYSPDSLVELSELLKACDERGIDKIAITDHGSIQGALKAHKMAPDRVIVAEEVETPEGELLGYFMTEEIPQGLPAVEVVRRLRGQGAFTSMAHPFDPFRSWWTEKTLEQILPYIDGLEVFNARCLTRDINDKAKAFAEAFGLACAAGSDAHSIGEIGTATLKLPAFQTADEFREALKTAEVNGRLSSPAVHLISRHAEMLKKIQHS